MNETRKPLMRRMFARRKVVRAAIVLAAAALLVRFLIVPGFWWGYAEWTLESYLEAPGEKRAVILKTLIEAGVTSKEFQERALNACLRSQIQMRDAYPAGYDVWISVEYPENWSYFFLHRTLFFSGEEANSVSAYAKIPEEMQFVRWPRNASTPGSATAELVVRHDSSEKYFLWDGWWDRVPRWTFSGVPRLPTTPFEYRQELELRFVPTGDFNEIKFEGSPELDRMIADSISCTPPVPTKFPQFPISRFETVLSITCEDIPSDLAVRIEYVDKGFPDLPIELFPVRDVDSRDGISGINLPREALIVGKKGSSGQIDITTEYFMFSQAGTHHGTLRLTTDREAALMDPRIDRVWDGTLEFPVTVAIEEVQGE